MNVQGTRDSGRLTGENVGFVATLGTHHRLNTKGGDEHRSRHQKKFF